MLLGAHLGGLVNFSLSDNLSVEPQVLYSMKGANVEIENVVSGTETYVYRLSYLEIPIWVRYQLESGLNFQAGPHIGILLGAEFDGEDAKDGMNSFDFGVGGGLGYQTGKWIRLRTQLLPRTGQHSRYTREAMKISPMPITASNSASVTL
jgi:hypothetical protein